MKTLKIILIISLIVGLGILIVFLLKDASKKKIKILDCEQLYKLNEPKPGFLEVSESNAKVDVATCLCEKYLQNKDEKYKKEIIKLYYEPFGGMRLVIENPEENIDSLCKHRNAVFTKMFNL
ncbi:hypothetical protein [Chryseobacterium wangxinyae]|uniref:hypothetical protein n=1 Tax=unclassified Chryseobacterium TaxID=2593645 RepID=UPI00226F2937|nr:MULTISPECIES: hypothetical protein [unclassified Chryseobacterium]MCY0968956.1 hypothetical protein [Chryseobacterium sp. CY353]MCY0976159.1 hypothetical protein [Chryseobacterium sp. CY350]WBZ94242.1 hypothetical protein PGH12_12235 [Chryseobacterium sp. CY350]